MRPTPVSSTQKNKVRPINPVRKKTAAFIRSVPAIIAIAKNGGNPTAAEMKVRIPLITGRPSTKPAHFSYCA